jgi:predicted TIM-barrel fold metal-dependent hydrolase
MAMSDADKLRALLPHWIEHNAEHAAEFCSWAVRACVAGHKDAAEEIEAAAKELGRVNEALRTALQHLGALT